MARKSAVTNADLTQGVDDDEPSLPGFAMSDEPFTGSPLRAEASSGEPFEQAPAVSEPLPITPTPIAPGAAVRYQSRIHIVDAWQYAGSLGVAPAFVDRNWASWGEYDEHRKLPPGPALRVPTPGPVAEKMCRVGDYVVKQSVTLAHGVPPEEHIDVWTREAFEQLFLPTQEPAKNENAP